MSKSHASLEVAAFTWLGATESILAFEHCHCREVRHETLLFNVSRVKTLESEWSQPYQCINIGPTCGKSLHYARRGEPFKGNAKMELLYILMMSVSSFPLSISMIEVF